MAQVQSRYAIGSPSASGSNQNVDQKQSSSGSGSQTQNTSGSQSSQSATTGTQTTNSSTQNMSSANMRILDNLIAQLMSGGTAEIRGQVARRDAETATVQGIRNAYTKEDAFTDSQGLIAQQTRRALEALMPSITRASEDAGSSGGALRALLLQDAANKAAESASALGVQTAAQYGQVATGLSGVLENLTKVDPVATNALIQALNVAKGAIQTSTSTTNSSQQQVQNQTSSQQQTSNTNENKKVSTDYAPFSVDANPTSQIYFGPTESFTDPKKYVGSTVDFLAQLQGNSNPWTSYTF